VPPRPLDARKVPDARAASRLEKLGIGRREMRRVQWPGRPEVEAFMQILSCSEVQACHAAAYARFRDLEMPVEPLSLDSFQDECMTQILARGLRDPEHPKELPLATDAADLRDNTTVHERAAVFQLYADFVAEMDPDPTRLPPDLVHQIEELVKKKGETWLRELVSSSLASSSPTSDSQPESSPTGSSRSSS